MRTASEFEGKTLEEVAERLLEGWNWWSGYIPRQWGVRLLAAAAPPDEVQQLYGKPVAEVLPVLKEYARRYKVTSAKFEEWTTGWGPSFCYHYELTLVVDKELLGGRGAAHSDVEALFGSGGSIRCDVEGRKIRLSADK